MSMYLCYDIRGIQQFIFSIPRLKCMIGASGIIAEFDDNSESIGESLGAEPIFTGGGRGAFRCQDEQVAERLSEALVRAAHDDKVGLDLRIGIDERFSQAVHHADQLFPYSPGQLDGPPCSLSGLWPVAPGMGRGRHRDVHPTVWQRARLAARDRLGKSVLQQLHNNLDELLTQEADVDVAARLHELFETYEVTFFKNVTPEPEDEEGAEEKSQGEKVAKAGQSALGRRNRWAVIAMDGNDMGRQFSALEERRESDNGAEGPMWRSLRAMSESLKTCTQNAFLVALGRMTAAWANALDRDALVHCTVKSNGGKDMLVLPFRPLILGGDDVTMLCHSAHALRFVQAMSGAFARMSRQAAQEASDSLWSATNGQLTISAGILFTKVSFPLHMAIPYAESLLASAKGRYRADVESAEPTAAAVDWETITETLVDTPAARRNRELRFTDEELSLDVCLTRRPYLLKQRNDDEPDLPSLLEVKDQLAGRKNKSHEIPTSVRAAILPALKRPWSERMAFYASIAKRYPILKKQLWEEDGNLGSAWLQDADGSTRETGLPDALLLLEEEHRTAQVTVAS